MADHQQEEADLLDALADGGLLAALEPRPLRPETAEENYAHHVGMRRATIFSGCLCGVIVALIVLITFTAIWATGEVPFFDPPVTCRNVSFNSSRWISTANIHLIQGDNGVSYLLYIKYLAFWHHLCTNSLDKIVTRSVFRQHRLVLYSSDTFPPFSVERILMEVNTTDRVLHLMDAELDQYVYDIPTLLGGPWSVYFNGSIYFFMDSPQASAPPGLGALYIVNLATGKLQTLGAAGWNPSWVAKFGDVWINSTKERMDWCHPFMFQIFRGNPVPYLVWGFNGGSGCHDSFTRWHSNAGMAPLNFGTNTTWNFNVAQQFLLPAAYNTTLLLTNFMSLPERGLPENGTIARALYEPISSLPWTPPWNPNWAALYINADLSAVLTAPAFWRSHEDVSKNCLLWRNGRMAEPSGDEVWYRVLCGGYGGNIGRRGVRIGNFWVVFDPDQDDFFTLHGPDPSRSASFATPTAAHLNTNRQAELWPMQQTVRNELGTEVYQQWPSVYYQGVFYYPEESGGKKV